MLFGRQEAMAAVLAVVRIAVVIGRIPSGGIV